MSVAPFRAVRTQEQIVAQCEARMAELEQTAASPQMKFPCATCRWADKFKAAWCHHPLVKGFGEEFHMGMDRSGLPHKRYPPLCGPEKALWEPKLSLWQRLLNWLFDL
ncbi:MAG: hypothetical protein ACRCYS_15145 [Beijerinckiaceae bacterium]